MNVIKAIALALAAAAAATLIGTAHAETFDFESVAPPAYTASLVPDGYAGAQWSGFVLRRTTDFTGGSNGFLINNTTMALATEAAPTITFAAPTVFTGAFLGVNSYLASPAVGFDLFLGGALVASTPTLGFGASFVGSGHAGPIDKIVFHVANADRLTIDALVATSVVPEPETVVLFLAGLMLWMAWRARGRKD